MAQVSFANRQVSCKIVYYGPGLSGKTTNIEVVHEKVPDAHRGQLTSIATEGDRTLFFDFMPLDLGSVAGMQTKFQLYTVPGQVYYNATRKLVLRGADGVVFVADSAPDRMEANMESLANLEENLQEHGISLSDFPFVIQYNKRDVPNAVSLALLDSRLNRWHAPYFEAVASKGEGVMPTLKALSKLVLDRLNDRYGARTIANTGISVRVREMSLPAGRGGEMRVESDTTTPLRQMAVRPVVVAELPPSGAASARITPPRVETVGAAAISPAGAAPARPRLMCDLPQGGARSKTRTITYVILGACIASGIAVTIVRLFS